MRESVIGVFLFLLSADFLRREPELVFFFAITNEFFPNNITPIVVQTYVCVCVCVCVCEGAWQGIIFLGKRYSSAGTNTHCRAQYRARIGKHAPGAIVALFFIAQAEREA